MKTPIRFPFGSCPLAIATFHLFAAFPASAQVQVQIIPADAVPAEGARPAAPPAQAAAPAAEVKPEVPDFAKSLLTMKFDRSPEALLAATRAQRKGGELSQEEAFKMSVMFGDWAEVGKTLASLAPEGAVAGYAKLLDSLASQSIPVGMVLKSPDQSSDDVDPFEENTRLQIERNELKKKSAPLLSEDFYGIVDASPADLKEENIPSLTKLAKTALGEGGRGTLVAKLKSGWKGLGGSTPEGRKLATSLLSSLGWIKDAAPFLPLDKQEWENATRPSWCSRWSISHKPASQIGMNGSCNRLLSCVHG